MCVCVCARARASIIYIYSRLADCRIHTQISQYVILHTHARVFERPLIPKTEQGRCEASGVEAGVCVCVSS